MPTTDDTFNVFFNSLDATGMNSYTWFPSNLKVGAPIVVSLQEIKETSHSQSVTNYNDQVQLDKLELESYYKMRRELIEEGLINDD